ncbi:MAG: hypothetical protein LIO81_02655 [Clostridiales bacterium]|nr:hypothetical protein [Clostridiales bacterium]
MINIYLGYQGSEFEYVDKKDAESFAVCSTSFAVRKKTVLSVIKLIMKGNAFITSLFYHGVLVA